MKQTFTIEKTSKATGNQNTMEIMLDLADYDKWLAGGLIQDCLPYLTAAEREFLLSGMTPQEWDYFFSED